MVDPFKMKVSTSWPKEKCSSIKPLAQNKVDYTELFDFAVTTDVDGSGVVDVDDSKYNFAMRVDNSLAGQMRDCGECHVGGGGMEYVMAAKGADLSTTARSSLRNDELSMLSGGTSFNSYEYFVDQFDEDNDGVLGEVIQQDYSVTGVLEMDCLMCHMEGYSWNDRKEAVRKGNFDSSRTAGAGLGTVATGTTVTYDAFNVVDDGGNATLAAPVLDAIKATPPSANCSSCHFDLHQVDWKKRGTSWNANMDYQTEVHASLGCMGCHERTDGVDMDPNNTDSSADNTDIQANWTGNAAGAGKDVLGHDPSKQFAPYSSLWNANDGKGGAKTCAACHTEPANVAYGDYGAADPTATHAALGLTALIGQKGRDGVADASHLDFIACDACHTRKLGRGPSAAEGGSTHGSLYEWGTGGAMVDSTGADADGRVTDHENLYVERTMEDNMVRGWSGGKLSSRHGLVTMFWRDKDDLFGYGNAPVGNSNYVDINADGQTGAMDAVNPSHVRDAMDAAGLDVLSHDGVITAAEISAQANALYNYLPGVGINLDPDGNGTPNKKLKLSFMGVLFRANHNTSPASAAWGAGGCVDCHADGAGFYNGGYDLKPRDLNASWDNFVYAADGVTKVTDNSAISGGKPKWKYVVPFTKVNKADFDGDGTQVVCSSDYTDVGGVVGDACSGGGVYTSYGVGDRKEDWQFSDFHPTLWAKGLTSRSIAVNAAFASSNTIRTIDRSELIYEKDSTVAGAPGARTMVDGTVAGTRAAIVANLNSKGDLYNVGMHKTHYWDDASAATSCDQCHTSMSDFTIKATGNFAGTDFTATQGTSADGCNEWAVVDPDGVASNGDEFIDCVDVIPGAPTGRYTCATACHPALDGSTAKAVVKAEFGGLPSETVNYAADFNTTLVAYKQGSCWDADATCSETDDVTNVLTACYTVEQLEGVALGVDEVTKTNQTCDYGWTVSAGTAIVGGDATTTNINVLYDPLVGNGTADDPLTLDVDESMLVTACLTMTMTGVVDDVATTGFDETVANGTTDTQCVTVEAVEVEAVPVVDATAMTADVAVGQVTITGPAGTFDDVRQAYIYWGDRTRTVVKPTATLTAAEQFEAGVVGPDTGGNWRVVFMDNNHAETFVVPADL